MSVADACKGHACVMPMRRRDGEWVVIRVVRYSENEAPRPANFATIQQTFEAKGFKGHFASVAFADSRQADASNDKPIPLYRGYGMYVAYGGLEGEGG